MPREKEHFRDQLERLDILFPNKEVLTVEETAGILNVCERTVKRKIVRTPDGKVAKVWLASYMVTKRKEH
ncbi:MAG: hypothetical protein RSF40_01935 [Oscillospiraceae bacterium]